MKYTATLNGKQYEVELERVDDYSPIPRYGEAAPAAPAPAAKPAPSAAVGDGFMNIPDGIDEELPFD